MSLQVETLQASFRKIKPQADAFVDSFYENLFTDYPAASPLFQHSDMKKQATMLKACLLMVVENLRHPGRMHEMLSGLGTRHVAYGALPEHYPLVGNSLLKTFEQYLKEDWTPDVKQSWVEAYAAITAIMLEGCDYPEESVDLDSASRPSPTQSPEPVGVASHMAKPSVQPVGPHQPQATQDLAPNSTATLSPSLAAQSAKNAPNNEPEPPRENHPDNLTHHTESNFPALPLAGSIVGAGGVVLLLLLLL